MEQSVPDHVDAQPGHRVGGEALEPDPVVAAVAQHVVPLEELVQQDAVDEAAQADAEEQTWQPEQASIPRGVHLGAGTHTGPLSMRRSVHRP